MRCRPKSIRRDAVLGAPFGPRDRFGLHVTILHPDQGARLEQAWDDIVDIPDLGSFEVSALQIVDSTNEPIIEIGLGTG